MKADILKLAAISKKKSRIILGLMSGTSLDGLDLGLCKIIGSGATTKVELLHFKSVVYDKLWKSRVEKVFAKRQIDFQDLVLLNNHLAGYHSKLILAALKEWNVDPNQVDLIASHGQTVFHAPRHQHKLKAFGDSTLQISDGDHLAVQTGIITISDFRQKHVAAGGEGAPLATYADLLLFQEPGKDVVLINIGGISNFSVLSAKGQTWTADTGPGNNLMNFYARKYFQIEYDKDAAIARSGKVYQPLLKKLKQHPYFKLAFPKTTGPEVFHLNFVEKSIESIKKPIAPQDVMATLNRLTAETIADGIKAYCKGKPKIYVSGGGFFNPLLMDNLKELLPGSEIKGTDAKGISPDGKESILFALLANELVAGETGFFKENVPGLPAISMGKISLPH